MSEDKPVYLDAKDVDQEALQKEYEAGILSLRELAAKFNLDPKKGHVQIKRIADRFGWTQDLNAKIQAKAEAKLRKTVLPKEQQKAPRIADAVIIEANAEAIMLVRSRHRTDISRAMGLTGKLMDELEQHTDNRELLDQLGELMYSPDKNGKDRLNEIYQAVISLPERIKSGKALSETLKNLIGLEREAYNITDEDPESKGKGTVNVTVKQYSIPQK